MLEIRYRLVLIQTIFLVKNIYNYSLLISSIYLWLILYLFISIKGWKKVKISVYYNLNSLCF